MYATILTYVIFINVFTSPNTIYAANYSSYITLNYTLIKSEINVTLYLRCAINICKFGDRNTSLKYLNTNKYDLYIMYKHYTIAPEINVTYVDSTQLTYCNFLNTTIVIWIYFAKFHLQLLKLIPHLCVFYLFNIRKFPEYTRFVKLLICYNYSSYNVYKNSLQLFL